MHVGHANGLFQWDTLVGYPILLIFNLFSQVILWS